MKIPIIFTSSSSSFFCVATLIAPLLYGITILFYAVNIPVGDDYSLLAFMNQFYVLTSLNDQIVLLFSLHNEHRLIFLRAISLLVEAAFGSLDFKILILIGNSVLLFAVLQIGRALEFRNDIFKWALLLLLTLQPQTLKLMFYPMAIIQAYFGLFFLVIYLRYLLEKKYFLLPMLMYLLAIITSGSGIFLIFVGAPLLLYQKRRKDLLIHLIFSLISSILYFQNFSGGGLLKLNYLYHHPMQATSFFLRLLGNIFQLPHFIDTDSYISLLFGALLIAYIIFHLIITLRVEYKKKKRIYVKQLVFLFTCIMIISLIVLGRTEIYQENLEQAAIDGRYRIYGILFTAISIISILQFFSMRGYLSQRIKMIIILFAIIFNVGWFTASFNNASYTTKFRSEAMNAYLTEGDSSGLSTWAVDHQEAIINLDLAISVGTYKPYRGSPFCLGDEK